MTCFIWEITIAACSCYPPLPLLDLRFLSLVPPPLSCGKTTSPYSLPRSHLHLGRTESRLQKYQYWQFWCALSTFSGLRHYDYLLFLESFVSRTDYAKNVNQSSSIIALRANNGQRTYRLCKSRLVLVHYVVT